MEFYRLSSGFFNYSIQNNCVVNHIKPTKQSMKNSPEDALIDAPTDSNCQRIANTESVFNKCFFHNLFQLLFRNIFFSVDMSRGFFTLPQGFFLQYTNSPTSVKEFFYLTPRFFSSIYQFAHCSIVDATIGNVTVVSVRNTTLLQFYSCFRQKHHASS